MAAKRPVVKIARGSSDPGLEQYKSALERYLAEHPTAKESELYRHGRYSVRVRVVDPEFEGMNKKDRQNRVWPYLVSLPEETLSDLSFLVLVSPEEKSKQLSSIEFDDPIPATL